MQRLLLASTNRGKTNELAVQLDGLASVICLADLALVPTPPEETGLTFRDNALLKADYYHEATGMLTLADDSGLEVDALGGRPGVFSARYGGEGLADAERNLVLLAEMGNCAGQPRTARFVCCLALVGEVGPAPSVVPVRHTFEATCEGELALAPRGASGFGYDPIFIEPASGQTYGEISAEEKARLSHRGKAVRILKEFWQSSLSPLFPSGLIQIESA